MRFRHSKQKTHFSSRTPARSPAQESNPQGSARAAGPPRHRTCPQNNRHSIPMRFRQHVGFATLSELGSRTSHIADLLPSVARALACAATGAQGAVAPVRIAADPSWKDRAECPSARLSAIGSRTGVRGDRRTRRCRAGRFAAATHVARWIRPPRLGQEPSTAPAPAPLWERSRPLGARIANSTRHESPRLAIEALDRLLPLRSRTTGGPSSREAVRRGLAGVGSNDRRCNPGYGVKPATVVTKPSAFTTTA